jgi:hypothetical protein
MQWQLRKQRQRNRQRRRQLPRRQRQRRKNSTLSIHPGLENSGSPAPFFDYISIVGAFLEIFFEIRLNA